VNQKKTKSSNLNRIAEGDEKPFAARKRIAEGRLIEEPRFVPAKNTVRNCAEEATRRGERASNRHLSPEAAEKTDAPLIVFWIPTATRRRVQFHPVILVKNPRIGLIHFDSPRLGMIHPCRIPPKKPANRFDRFDLLGFAWIRSDPRAPVEDGPATPACHPTPDSAPPGCPCSHPASAGSPIHLVICLSLSGLHSGSLTF
jgi:hypothetical protein